MKKIISIILLILATVNMTNAEELAFRGISLKNKKTATNIEAQLKSKGYKFYGYESGLKLFHGTWAARECINCYGKLQPGYDDLGGNDGSLNKTLWQTSLLLELFPRKF